MKPSAADKKDIETQDWGLVPYNDALERQLALHAQRVSNRIPDTVVFVEHPPTVTLGRNASDDDIVWGFPELVSNKIDVVRSDRAGRATFHGPGQIVTYPIVDVAIRALGAKAWVEMIEDVLIATLAVYGVRGERHRGHPGIWSRGAKIASIGLRIARGVSYHGFALNTDLDPKVFDCIVTCGVSNERVTSLALETDEAPNAQTLKKTISDHLADSLGEYPQKNVLKQSRSATTNS